ncbi:MAG: hypothetical protein ACLQVA_08110 [Candidatus Brocadiia bacterium]
MAKNTKPTAAQAYQGCQNDVGALLDLIGQEMKRHAEYAKTDGLHWGHVGDVLQVRKCLVEVLAQLAQQDEAFIENHLAEMRESRKL